MKPSLRTVPAIAKNLPEIMALDQLCFGGIWNEEGYLKEIHSSKSSLLLLRITRAKLAPQMIGIGCLWSIVEEAHITLLGIHPQYQSQGLGMLLLHHLLQDAVNRNLERATLEVKETNQPAINLYQKFGFKIAGKRRNYYLQTGEDALILWLNGLDKPEFRQKMDIWQTEISDRIYPNYRLNSSPLMS